MPRFFFHVHNSIEIPDPEGLEMPSLTEARTEAIKAARALMADDITTKGEITLSHSITVEHEDGSPGFVLPFRGCVEIHP